MFKCKKRILVLLIALFVVGLQIHVKPQQAMAATKTSTKQNEVLTLSGIIADQDGTLMISGKTVTRAEFAKVLVAASEQNSEVKKTSNVQLFPDVKKSSNASAYIRIAVTQGWMRGYSDGKFHPDQKITLKEAIYGVLQVLGYDEKAFETSYTGARFAKYKELKLANGISLKENDVLTVKACKTLFYNLLTAKTAEGDYYAKKINVPLTDKNEIDFDQLVKQSKKGPVLAKGSWKDKIPSKGKGYTVYLNGKKSNLSKVTENSIVVYCPVLKKLWAYNKVTYGTLETISPDNLAPTQITVSGVNYAVQDSTFFKKSLNKSTMKIGSQVAVLLGEKGQAAYLYPVTVQLNDKYQVIYSCKEMNKKWTYSKQIRGTLESLAPNKTNPSTLVVEGETYTVGNLNLVKKAMKANKIDAGNQVILLLGKNNLVDYILPLNVTVATGKWDKKLDLQSFKMNKNDQGKTNAEPSNCDVVYYSKETKQLWYYDKKVYGLLDGITYNNGKLASISINQQVYNIENPNNCAKLLDKKQIEQGTLVVALLGKNQAVSSILPIQSKVAENNWAGTIAFNVTDSASKVYLNGKLTQVSAVAGNDVIYYSNELKTVWAFDTKKYGTLTSITPNEASPAQIEVAGKTYSLTSLPVGKHASVTLSQNAWGSYFASHNITKGMKVEVLFGYGDTVAALLPIENVQTTFTGCVISVGSKIVQDDNLASKVKRTIEIVDTTGTTQDFVCEDTNIVKGDIVTATYENGKTTVTKQSKVSSADLANKSAFAPDARVLAIQKDGSDITYAVLTPSKYQAIQLTQSKVSYIQSKNGLITDLILDGYVDTTYQYGVIRSVDADAHGNITISVYMNGQLQRMSVSSAMPNLSEGAKRFVMSGGSISQILPLEEVKIDAVNGAKVTVGTKSIYLADNAKVYLFGNSSYNEVNLDQVSNTKEYRLTGYLNQSMDNGGEVAIILAVKQ